VCISTDFYKLLLFALHQLCAKDLNTQYTEQHTVIFISFSKLSATQLSRNI